MIDRVKKVIEQIEKLPKQKQMEIAQGIMDELNWEESFQGSQNELSTLAKEALKEYQSGNTSNKDWFSPGL